jgi:hypothetical protein
MENTTIFYITTKKSIVQHLAEYCAVQQINLIAYTVQKCPKVDYLLIIEPIEIGPTKYSLSKVWKSWLFVHAPQTKLITAIYAHSAHSNNLNLLKLPVNLSEFLEQTLPVGAFSPQYAGSKPIKGQKKDVYNDPWERFLTLNGHDIKKEMEKFIEGHDKNNSFYEIILNIRTNLKNLEYRLNPEHNLYDQQEINQLINDTTRSWEYMQIRWNYYLKYFEWLPFHDTIQDISKIMYELGEKMNDLSNTENLPPSEWLSYLNKLVEEGIQQYIYYTEDIW